jgi:hypothetical protein
MMRKTEMVVLFGRRVCCKLVYWYIEEFVVNWKENAKLEC